MTDSIASSRPNPAPYARIHRAYARIHRWRRALLSAGILGMGGVLLGATPPPADPLLARLQAKIDGLSTLRGRFVQRLDSRVGPARVEQGTFALRKPASMRWEYTAPEVKLAITDGEETWLYLPEDFEVQHGTLPEQGGGAAHLLLAGRMRLDSDFETRRLTPEEAGPQGVAGAVVIELKPRGTTEEFERLILSAEPESLQIRRLTLVDAIGGRMVFEFYDLDEDPELADDLFRFEIPPGVEVIETP